MDSYEFELFAFWDDLEYADDAYFDYGLSSTNDQLVAVKRKHDPGRRKNVINKRRKMQTKAVIQRDDDPLLLVSRADRIKAFFKPAPLLEDATKYSFLPNWKERYAKEEGVVGMKDMPVDMKRAAEAEAQEAEEGDRQISMEEDMLQGEAEGEWEDDEEGDEGEGGADKEGPGLDSSIVQEILKQKLGEAGLGDENEAAFMQVIAKMMSGEGDPDDAAGDLANSLLGKLNADTGGDSALSAWLSQQGIELHGEDDKDASDEVTAELPGGQRHFSLHTRQEAQDSPIDSVVDGTHKRASSQMPFHSGSPTASTKKKRTAFSMEEDGKPSKKQKRVASDVQSSSPTNNLAQNPPSEAGFDLLTNKDPIKFENKLERGPIHPHAADGEPSDDLGVEAVDDVVDYKNRRGKRKAIAVGVTEERPEKKKKGTKGMDGLDGAAEGSPKEPPAKRTRAAKAKAAK